MQPLFIFISYSRQDEAIANELARLLERGGHDPFIDRELLPGQHWKDILQAEIDRCDAFVYMLSPSSLNSEWCQWEYNEAVRQKKPIFPIKVEEYSSFPENLKSIGDIQMLDMTKGITSESAVALMGGFFHVRATPQKESLAIGKNDDPLPGLEVHYDDTSRTEPLTRLPLPLENPLPKSVTATIRIVQSPTVATAEYKIYSTTYKIGRSSQGHLQITEKRISKHHAMLYWSNGRFRLTDYSKNGTWLNGEQLTSNQSYLLAPDFNHRIDLAQNYTVLNFRYTVGDMRKQIPFRPLR
ncbi:MAG: TIR domain-containing protein [Anaerolineae bacterium]|nr:TIR domain-containing protein [Anaerolineae bacterium]MDQ7034541.1 TIR domain-containing protein [Anaerolineae bacterium]